MSQSEYGKYLYQQNREKRLAKMAEYRRSKGIPEKVCCDPIDLPMRQETIPQSVWFRGNIVPRNCDL